MKNILPQDTRAIEFISAWALIFIGISIWLGPTESTILNYNSCNFWMISSILFGAMQFISVMDCKNLQLMRTILSWIVGFFFVWLGVSSIPHSQTPTNYTAIILGFGNWYAFILNLNFMRKEWIN